ncbi:MAG: sugar transferase [bacterium]|nr:sugar transferase [bacterium]
MQYRKRITKRVIDILIASVLILILAPLALVIAMAIYIESPGPIFYYQKRVGKGYKIFPFFKFRSMRINADKEVDALKAQSQYLQNENSKSSISEEKKLTPHSIRVSDDEIISETAYLEEQEQDEKAAFFKLEDDPRITKVGSFIRKTSIDELPQLLNVLRGEMSIVGNRPLPLYEAEKLTSDSAIERFQGPAGITGLWQVTDRGKSDVGVESRIAKDIYYARNYNLLMDMWILFKTPFAAVQKVNV